MRLYPRGRFVVCCLLIGCGNKPTEQATATTVPVPEAAAPAGSTTPAQAFFEDRAGEMPPDTVEVRNASFNRELITELKNDPAYDYDRRLHVEELLWDRVRRRIADWINEKFGRRAGRWFSRNLDWILATLAILALVFIFRRRLFSGVVAPDPAKAKQVRAVEEHMDTADLNAELAKAEQREDWRTALRFQYLLVLRRLMEKDLIDMEPRYTDQDYLHQLEDPADRAGFQRISFLFKWAWYGGAPMEAQHYEELAPAFRQFHANTP